jgi:DNA topoisomerase-1
VIAFQQICAAGDEGVGLKAMLEPVAEALGNTPAISRKSYVHPMIIDAVKTAPAKRLSLQCPRASKYLSSAERGLIAFLGRRMGRQRKAA